MQKLSEILSDESKWCQGKWFIGDQCCLEGALIKSFGAETKTVRRMQGYQDAISLINVIIKEAHGKEVEYAGQFNDQATYEDVYAIAVEFDRRVQFLEMHGKTFSTELLEVDETFIEDPEPAQLSSP